MTKVDHFHEFVMNEIFRTFPSITSRPMFGGWGIYNEGLFFALIDNDRLYFKVDESNQEDYEKAGSSIFEYTMPNGKKMKMSYWEVPEEILEDALELKTWVDKAVAVARKAKKKS